MTEQVHELVRLCRNVDNGFKKLPYDQAVEQQSKIERRIREIGRELFDQGGEELKGHGYRVGRGTREAQRAPA